MGIQLKSKGTLSDRTEKAKYPDQILETKLHDPYRKGAVVLKKYKIHCD